MKPGLTVELLLDNAAAFAEIESNHDEPLLFGVTDGKAVGTYLEHKFVNYLGLNYTFSEGSSALGIDLPSLGVDIKVTSAKQPQSSCPFRSARQKIYGLGYHLLVFVYDKSDDHRVQTSRLDIRQTIFIDQSRTADFQMTHGLLQIIENEGNVEDITAFMNDKNLPIDDIGAHELANEILLHPPSLGYLTISNALQWRLQYGRAIAQAGTVSGLLKIR